MSAVPLVSTDAYDPRREEGRDFAAFTSGLGLSLFGSIYTSVALDIHAEVLKALSGPDLGRYFTGAEREELAARLDRETRSRFLSGALDNAKANGALRFLVSELGARVVDRVMEKEGVKDPARRRAWAGRLLAPFQGCMREVREFREASRCASAFKQDIIYNLGLALSSELVRQEMSPAVAGARPAEYQKCLQPERPNAANRVKDCVLTAVRGGALEYGKTALLKEAEAKAPGSGAAIVAQQAPKFKACLERAKDPKGFHACGDALTQSAGSDIAAAAIRANEQVRSAFPDAAAREKVVLAGAAAFRDCAARAKPADAKDSSALEACGARVKMEVARLVARETLRVNVGDASQAPPGPRARMEAEVDGVLGACWNSAASEQKNSDCLKTAIRRLVQTVASYRLDQELPEKLSAQAPGLKPDLLRRIDECVKTHLPANVLAGGDVASSLGVCSAPLMREAALKIASFQIGDVLSGKDRDPATARRLDQQLVQAGFKQCLGEAPTSEVLATCSQRLRFDAGREIAAALLPEELDAFLKKGGGLAAYNIPQSRRDEFLKSLLERHDACLTARVKGNNKGASEGLDSCFKSTIQSLAVFLADLEFQKQVRAHLPDNQAGPELAAKFLGEFRACLAEKDAARFPVGDYVAQLDTCRLRLTKKYTLEMGRTLLAQAYDENVGKNDPAEAAKKNEFVQRLGQQFETCLAPVGADDAAGRDACADQLKNRATATLVLEATRAQSRKFLNNGAAPPAEIAKLEQAFAECLKKGDTDECARAHVAGVASAVAHLKLHHTMADMLGTDYPTNLAAINDLERDFHACLAALPDRKLSSAYVAKVSACSDSLEAAGVRFSQRYLKEIFVNPGQDARSRDLAVDAALAVPCLDGIAVQKPFDQQFLERYDPEGTFSIMAKLLGDYINYDADKAGEDYQVVLAQIARDLETVGAPEARRHLLKTIVERGMVDQLLKSMIRAEIKKSLLEQPAADRLPDAALESLIAKERLEKVLTPELMAKLRPFLADKVLTPLILEGKSMKAPAQQAAIHTLESQISDALLASDEFTGFLVESAVQKQIDNKAVGGAVTKWIATRILGYYKTLNWKDVRSTEKGRAAEAYLREQIVKPQLKKEELSPEEKAKRQKEASRLVEEALK